MSCFYNLYRFPTIAQIILSKLEAGLHLDKFHLLSRTKEPACHLKLAPKRQNKGMPHSNNREAIYCTKENYWWGFILAELAQAVSAPN